MPLWAARTLAVVLFTAAMLAVRAVLQLVVPGFSFWLGETFGQAGATIGVIAACALLCLYGFWPRDPAGRMCPLLPRRL